MARVALGRAGNGVPTAANLAFQAAHAAARDAVHAPLDIDGLRAGLTRAGFDNQAVHSAAAAKLAWLIGEMRRLGLTGVELKDAEGMARI